MSNLLHHNGIKIDEILFHMKAPEGCYIEISGHELGEMLSLVKCADFDCRSSCMVKGSFVSVKPSDDGGVIAVVRDGDVSFVVVLPPPSNSTNTDYIKTSVGQLK